MEDLDPSLFTLKPLTSDIDVSGFCCSEEELNDYVKVEALRDQQYLFSTTHILFYDTTVVGYFTLVNDTINPDKISEVISKKYEYAKLPALKIARLAVDKNYVGLGIGTMMVSYIYNIVINMIKTTGCRVITVDSKKDAQPFYERLQFKIVKHKGDPTTIPMFIDVKFILDVAQ